MAKKKASGDAGDFRYAAGDSKVPWHAVGEGFSHSDVVEFVKFLMPPEAGSTEYAARLRDDVGQLGQEGRGNHAQGVEGQVRLLPE